jgi:hypothetical protein
VVRLLPGLYGAWQALTGPGRSKQSWELGMLAGPDGEMMLGLLV